MNYLLLALTSLTSSSQSIFQRKYNDNKGVGTFLFSGMLSFFAMLFFIAVNTDWYYSIELLLPSALFALSYCSGTLFAVLAIKHGSLAKTSLLTSCSMILASIYGIILGDPVGVFLILGTALLITSIVLVNYQKSSSPEKVSFKWVIFVSIAFLGNGMCMVVQKAKQVIYGNAGNNMFMITALAMVTVTMLVLSLVFKEERVTTKLSLSRGWYWALFCGIANGMTNLLVMYLNSAGVPASVLFPVVSGAGMTIIFLYSTLIRHEKLSKTQTVGFFIGVLSIVLLNL